MKDTEQRSAFFHLMCGLTAAALVPAALAGAQSLTLEGQTEYPQMSGARAVFTP